MCGLHDFPKQGRFACPGFACQENRLIRLINKMLGKFGRGTLFWIQFGLHLFEVTKIVRMIERRMNKNGFFILRENCPQKKPLLWSSFLIRVEPEGLAALSPQANVQWIKKLHREAMLSFFVFTNLRTSPHLCPQKKATPTE
jgi:hypothetical protein